MKSSVTLFVTPTPNFFFQDHDVIVRVEKLLSQRVLLKDMTQLTGSSKSSDDENGYPETVTVISLVATAKRALSDSYNSTEPLPKKLRIGSDAKHDDSTTTNSFCSDD